MLSRTELNNKPWLQLTLILALCLVFLVLFALIGGVIAVSIYGFEGIIMKDHIDPQMIGAMKLLQLFSAFGLFIIAPLAYGLFAGKNPFKVLDLNHSGKGINYLLVFVFMVVFTPFLSWLVEVNGAMSLPDFMAGIEEWMRSSEEQAARLTEAFLTFDGLGSLIYVLIIVAVVPAFGEEFVFRGIVQKSFIQWTRNIHLGIWITAFIFSAIHMQFFGFFPRMLLGVIFGYLFVWSKSLWLPILGHFINNGSVVLISYFAPEQLDNADISFMENEQYALLLSLSSLVLGVFVLLLMRKLNQKKMPATPSVSNE